MDMWRGEEMVRCMGRVKWKLTLPYVNIQPTVLVCVAQKTQTWALYKLRGMACEGRWEGVSKGREYMYPYG